MSHIEIDWIYIIYSIYINVRTQCVDHKQLTSRLFRATISFFNIKTDTSTRILKQCTNNLWDKYWCYMLKKARRLFALSISSLWICSCFFFGLFVSIRFSNQRLANLHWQAERQISLFMPTFCSTHETTSSQSMCEADWVEERSIDKFPWLMSIKHFQTIAWTFPF